MAEMTTIEETEDRYENTLAELCTGIVDRVEITMTGTLEIDVFDCSMADMDAIDDEVGVHSVERKAGGELCIESEQQVAPCVHGRE